MDDSLIIDSKSKQVQTICSHDSNMRRLIEQIGDIEVTLSSNFFKALVSSIVGQQLSVKVAAVINGRLEQLINHDFSPEVIVQIPDDKLRGIGLSGRKVSYVRDLCQKVLDEEVNLLELHRLSNSNVIAQLVKVKGIGEWTAEMFLIFSLGRLDVISLKDIGLQRGTKWLYELDSNEAGLAMMKEKSANWSPYLTIASLYLWEAVNRDFVIHFKNIDEMIQTKK